MLYERTDTEKKEKKGGVYFEVLALTTSFMKI